MNEDQKKEIISGLATNPEFLSALSICESQIPPSGQIRLNEIALWFFSQGYIAHMEYLESKPFNLRPYQYE